MIALKRYPAFAQSFSFIRTVLNPYRESLIYFIPEDDAKIDVDISLTEENVKNALHDLTYSVISLITVNGKDITELVKKHYLYRGISIQEAIAIATNAPIDAVTLHPNIPLLKNITFVKGDEDDAFYL